MSRESHSYLHKLGCQYGACGYRLLLGGQGSRSKKKEQVVMGGLGQSGLYFCLLFTCLYLVDCVDCVRALGWTVVDMMMAVRVWNDCEGGYLVVEIIGVETGGSVSE